MISLNAITTLHLLVVDLSLGVTLRADTADEVESRQAPTGTDGGIPNLISLAASPADTISSIVGLGRRADPATISDQVVALLTLARSVDPLLVGVAGCDTESETEQVSIVADTLLSDGGVGRVERTGGA